VAARTDFSDLSAVDKYVMPTPEYETRTDSVLAWKKAQKLGRFDPNAPSIEQQKILASEREVDERGKALLVDLKPYIRITMAAQTQATSMVGPIGGAESFEFHFMAPKQLSQAWLRIRYRTFPDRN